MYDMYDLKREDYLDLWKYFSDRADDIKEAMFNSVTWSIGFAAATFGFIISTLVEPSDSAIAPRLVALVGSAIGIVLCGYSCILVLESRKHIRRNWDRAAYCKGRFKELDEIILDYKHPKEKETIKDRVQHVWNQVFVVIAAFFFLFGALVVWMLASPGE